MADGPYTTRALRAASAAPNCGAGECPNCDKTGLAALVVTPTVADENYAKDVHGTIAPLLQGVADPVLTASGYALRTLRKGYLMAFYQDNPKVSIEAAGQHGWTLAKVDAGGYMTPTRFDLVESGQDAKSEPFSCSRTAGYASALLFVIPHAKRAGRVWVAFSSHPWSKKVRDAYAGSEALRNQGMTCIDASKAACNRSIKLTAENISKAIADFTPKLDPKAFEGNPFPIRPMASEHQEGVALARKVSFLRDITNQLMRPETPDDVIAQATEAIGKSKTGFTIADAMIVAVPDPEGITTTTAQRRITLCNTAAEWVDNFKDGAKDARPYEKTGYWRLQSALSIKGLMDIIADPGRKAVAEAIKHQGLNGQPITRREYDAKIKSGQLPPNAGFMPDVFQDSVGGHVAPSSTGTLTVPTPDAIRGNTQAQQAEVTEKLVGTAQGMNWQKFLDTYQSKTKHDEQLLAKCELDHKAWLQSAAFTQLYEHQFDETNHADGKAYAICVNNCLMGGPMSEAAMDWWKDFLVEDPSVKRNLLVRALLGNQAPFFTWFKEIDQTSKTWDELKGLLDLVKESREHAKQAQEKANKAEAAMAAGGDPHAAADAAKTAKMASGGAEAIAGAMEETKDTAQQLLNTATAVAASKDKAGTLSDTLRIQLKKLSISLMGKSEQGLEAVKLQVPVDVFARLCRSMVAETENLLSRTSQAAGR